MNAPDQPKSTVPPVIAMLTGHRREELRQEFARRTAAGEAKTKVIGDLAMTWGVAPSYVRMLLQR